MTVHNLDCEEKLIRAVPEVDDDLCVQRYVFSPVTIWAYIGVSTLSIMSVSILTRVLSATIDGTKYCRGTTVVCGCEEDIPMFGELIVTTHQECWFIISPLQTLCFHHHYHAYEVAPSSSLVVYRHRQLFDHHPLVCTKAVQCSTLVE